MYGNKVAFDQNKRVIIAISKKTTRYKRSERRGYNIKAKPIGVARTPKYYSYFFKFFSIHSNEL